MDTGVDLTCEIYKLISMNFMLTAVKKIQRFISIIIIYCTPGSTFNEHLHIKKHLRYKTRRRVYIKYYTI